MHQRSGFRGPSLRRNRRPVFACRRPVRAHILGRFAQPVVSVFSENQIMRRVVGMVVLAVGLGVLAGTSFSPAEAQDKDPKAKKVKDKDPKAKKGAPGGGGTVEIYKAKDGYRFRVKDGEGKTLAMPPRGHDSKDEVMKDLDAIRAILGKARPTEVKD